jgi:hypothetical protein
VSVIATRSDHLPAPLRALIYSTVAFRFAWLSCVAAIIPSSDIVWPAMVSDRAG